MKRNKLMFISGLLLTIGSTVLLPIIGVGASFLLDGDFDKGLNSVNGQIVLVAGIVVSALIPMIGVFLMIGSVLLPLIANKRAKNQILSDGQPAEAKILSLGETGTWINNNPVVNIALEVYPAGQQGFRTQVTQTVSMIHLPSYQPGKLLSVKYMPGTGQVAIVGTVPDK